MAQEIGAAVIGLVSWELKGLLLHWKPITGAPVRNRRFKSIYLFVCLSVFLSFCLSACLPVCLSACLPVCLSACLPACLSVNVFLARFACLRVDAFVCLFACVCTCVGSYAGRSACSWPCSYAAMHAMYEAMDPMYIRAYLCMQCAALRCAALLWAACYDNKRHAGTMAL